MDNRSVMQKWQGGKGSRRRPTNEQAFREKMEEIFPDKKPWYEDRDLSWLKSEDTHGPKA